MTLYYNGVDITDRVDTIAAVGHDVSGGCCDHMELEFENSALWLSWKPQTDDRIELVNGDYSSGTMYVSAMYPQDGTFRILASAIPSSARNRLCVAYKGMTISAIARSCALESDMEYTLYGVDEVRYGYMLRDREGCAAFLERVAKLEGSVLKCWNGRYTMIDILTAQAQDAKLTARFDSDMTGFDYTNNAHMRVRRLTVIAPCGRYTAEDTGAEGDLEMIVTDVPAENADQVKRWARALLLAHNRRAETLTMRGTFNPAQTAMARIDIDGENDVAGAWIIDGVEHDHVAGISTATLLRCIDTVT